MTSNFTTADRADVAAHTTPARVTMAVTALIGPGPMRLDRAALHAYRAQYIQTCLHLAESAIHTAHYAHEAGHSSDIVRDTLAEAVEYMAEYRHWTRADEI